MCSWNWEKLTFIRSFNFTLKSHCQYSTSISETSENVCFYFIIGFPWSLYSDTIFLWCGEELSSITKYLELSKKIKSSTKEYVMWTCFKYWPMKRIFQKLKDNGILITIYLQICRELSNLPIFFRVHSNSKEVAYVSYQNTYPNLNTTSLTVNVTPKELTPCKISHICRCAFNGCFSSNFYLILLCQ